MKCLKGKTFAVNRPEYFIFSTDQVNTANEDVHGHQIGQRIELQRLETIIHSNKHIHRFKKNTKIPDLATLTFLHCNNITDDFCTD